MILFYEIFIVAHASPICGIPTIRRLTQTSVNIRVTLSDNQFIAAFHNEATGRTAFVLIQNNQRIFGADNTGGWHVHPFANPAQHDSLNAPMTFLESVRSIELYRNQP